MERLLTRYIAFAARRALPLTVLFTLLLVGEILFLKDHFNLNADLQALFSGANRTVQDLEYLSSRVGTSSNVQILARSDSRENNLRFLTDLKGRIAGSELIRFVELDRDIAYLEQHALLLLPQEDLDRAEQKIRDIIARQTEKGLSLDHGEPEEGEKLAGDAAKELDDELDRVLAEIDANKRKYDISRHFTADNGRYVEMKVRPAGSDTNITSIKKVIDFLDREVAALDPQKYGVEVEVGGYYRHRVREVEEIRGNIVETIGICIVLLVLLMLYFFRAARALIIIFFPLSLGVVSGIVSVQFLVGEFNLISAFSFAMLYGLGIDYAIHTYSRYLEFKREGYSPDDALTAAYRSLWRPLLYSSLTTVAAFLTLFFIEFRGFSDFGLVAGVGVAFALVVILLVMPPLILLMEKTSPLPVRMADPTFLAALFRFLKERPRFLWAPGALTVAAMIGIFFVQFEYNLDKLSFKRKYDTASIVNQYTELLRKENKDSLSVSMPSFYLTDSPDEARAIADRLYVMKKEGKTSIRIRGVLALSNFVPTGQEEKLRSVARIRRLIERKQEILPDDIRARLERDIMPLLRIEGLIEQEKLPGWIADKLKERDGSIGKMVTVMLTGNKSNITDVIRIKNEFGMIQGKEKEHRLMGSHLLLADIKRVIETEAPLAVFLSFSTVFFFLLLTFHSIGAALLVYLPLVIGVLWMVGVMAATGMNFNLFNMVILPTIIGIGIDACIHIYSRYREEGRDGLEKVMAQTGKAVLFSSATTLIGFLSLLYGAHKGVITIGAIASVGIVTVTLSALVLFPLLLARYGKNDKFHRQEEQPQGGNQ